MIHKIKPHNLFHNFKPESSQLAFVFHFEIVFNHLSNVLQVENSFFQQVVIAGFRIAFVKISHNLDVAFRIHLEHVFEFGFFTMLKDLFFHFKSFVKNESREAKK